jgi:hypothetical protein
MISFPLLKIILSSCDRITKKRLRIAIQFKNIVIIICVVAITYIEWNENGE